MLGQRRIKLHLIMGGTPMPRSRALIEGFLADGAGDQEVGFEGSQAEADSGAGELAAVVEAYDAAVDAAVGELGEYVCGM
jgi:hypothetical protein